MTKEKTNLVVKPVTRVLTQATQQMNEMSKSDLIDIPNGYSYKNAIQNARYILEKPIASGRNKGETIMDVCTQESILASVMEMAQKGLNPAKEQCYFIPYGNQCTLSVSYQGHIAMAKMSNKDVDDVLGYAVYKDDEFEMNFNTEKGVLEVTKFKPVIEKRSPENLIGAIAVVINDKGVAKYTEYMTIDQIRSAWNMGYTKGSSPAHKYFPDQMAIKSVKNRAIKSYVRSSTDEDVYSYDEKVSASTDNQLNKEIQEKANSKVLEIDLNDDEIYEGMYEVVEDEEELTEEQQQMLDKAPF